MSKSITDKLIDGSLFGAMAMFYACLAIWLCGTIASMRNRKFLQEMKQLYEERHEREVAKSRHWRYVPRRLRAKVTVVR